MKPTVRITAMFLVLVLCAGIFTQFASAFTWNGQDTWIYGLSSGDDIRIEYHGGKVHYHVYRKGKPTNEGENLDGTRHDKLDPPNRKTRDIVRGKRQKNSADKKAAKKARDYQKALSQANAKARSASRQFVQKQKYVIRNAVRVGAEVVIICMVAYGVWVLFQFALGLGILTLAMI